MFGVVVSHASVLTCGNDLVASVHASFSGAAHAADMVMKAQPGCVAVVAEKVGGVWLVDGVPVREWLYQ